MTCSNACTTATAILLNQMIVAQAGWIGQYAGALGSSAAAVAWANYFTTTTAAWVTQAGADVAAWQAASHLAAAAGQAQADADAGALESYIQAVVADGVACVNTAANAANSLLKTVAADEVAAIDGWAANAKTYDLAYIAAALPLKQALATAAVTAGKACANAAFAEASTVWPQWLICSTAINDKVTNFYVNMAGEYKDYQVAVNQAVATKKTQLAPIDRKLAVDAAEAHQTWYVEAFTFANIAALQYDAAQLYQVLAMPSGAFAGAGGVSDVEMVSMVFPVTGSFMIKGGVEWALQGIAEGKGISFAGHYWAFDTCGMPGAQPMYCCFAASGASVGESASLMLAPSQYEASADSATVASGLQARGAAVVSSALGSQRGLSSDAFGLSTVSAMTAQSLANAGVGSPYLAGPRVPSNPVETFAPLHVAGMQYSYDAAGQLISVTDPLGNTTSYAYDSSSRCTSITDANGGQTQFTYDLAGNMTSLTDPVGNTTTWVYDDQNRPIQETNALGASRYYTYNTEGELARQVDRNGRVRQFEYDSQGRVVAESWFDTVADADAAQNATNAIHYEFDDAGNLTAEWDNYSSYTYAYDSMGRQTSVTIANPGQPVVVFTSQYDDNLPSPASAGEGQGVRALPISVLASIDGVPDYRRDYQYDSQGRMTQIIQTDQPGGSTVANLEVDLTYDANGNFQSITRYQDGHLVATSAYQYDLAGDLTSLVHSQGSNTLAAYSWTYDVTGLTSLDGSAGYSAGARLTSATSIDGTVEYSYDPTGQLTGADYIDDGLPDEAYSYDANGNRETANGSSYVTGAGNRLISDGTYTYSYDAEGNRTARFIDTDADGVLDAGDTQITVYGWDVRNRLTSVTVYATFGGDPAKIVEYRYDPENRLVAETVDSNGDGVVDHQTVFVYDGKQIALQFDKDGAGAVTGADLSHRYLAAVDQVFADEQVANPQTAGNLVWPLGDNLGTVRDLAINDPQTGVTSVANHRVFDSYGNLASQTNAAVDCVFGFTGFLTDKATGLDMSQTRPYEASTGRFIEQDKIGFTGRDTNLYRYCGNSPTNRTDPSGMAWFGLPSWSDYKFYLFNPSREDAWCRYGQVGALGVSAVAGAAAGGLAIAGMGGVTVTGAGSAIAGAGALTATQIQQLIASSGDRIVTVFTRLTQSPAADRILHAATDTGLPNAIARGSMYIGRIPADLFERLRLEGEITYAATEMGGVRGTEVIFSARAMQILQQYFQQHGG